MSAAPVAVPGRAALLPSPVAPAPAALTGGRSVAPLQRLYVRLFDPSIDERPADLERWGRLDRYSRALVRVTFEAAGAEATGAAAGAPHPDPRGLYVTSLHSCLETNAAFDRGLIEKGPRLASPKLFPYTLPGAGAAEAASALGLGDASICFTGGAATCLASIVAAADTMDETGASIIVAAADVLGPATLRSLAELGGLPGPGEPPLAEGACALWLAPAGDAHPGPRVQLEGALGGHDPAPSAWARLIAEALERAEIRSGEVTQIVTTATTTAARIREDEGLRMALGEHHPMPLRVAWRTGNAGAVLGLYAVLDAIEGGEPTVILAADDGGAVAMLAAASPVI